MQNHTTTFFKVSDYFQSIRGSRDHLCLYYRVFQTVSVIDLSTAGSTSLPGEIRFLSNALNSAEGLTRMENCGVLTLDGNLLRYF